MATGASTTFSKSLSWAAGPKIVTGTPARRPPSATLRGPRSAPFASSAITGRRLLGLGRSRDLAAPVCPADATHAMREHRRAALRARLQARRRDRVLRTPLVRARVRLLLLGDRHLRG